jgi:hypothetical protein
MKDEYNYCMLANKAHGILNSKGRLYPIHKALITLYFNNYRKEDIHHIIEIRLALIDYFYSTQMNRRYYGIEELANKIRDIYNFKDGEIEKIDKEMSKDYSIFLDNIDCSKAFNSRIYQLFENKYGIDKKGNEKGRAISLISKYGYFLTGYKFPIYDTLGKYGIKSLFGEIKSINSINDFMKYFSVIKKVNNVSKIVDYDKLDTLLWLYGKLFKDREKKSLWLLFLNGNDYTAYLKNSKQDRKIDEFEQLLIVDKGK